MTIFGPRRLEITTMNYCKIRCIPFCPQDAFVQAYKGRKAYLSFEDFALALSHTPEDVGMNFAGFVEPFLNPEAIDMVEYAHDMGRTIYLYTTLVGLTPEGVDRLAKVKLKELCLHLPDANGIAKIPDDANSREVLARALRKLHPTAFVSMNDHFRPNNRAGNAPMPDFHVRTRGPFVCSWLHAIYSPVMLPDGTCCCCCMDWGLRHILGNILECTYDDLLKSKEWKMLRHNSWGLNGNTLCRTCPVAITPARMVRHIGKDWRKIIYHSLPRWGSEV